MGLTLVVELRLKSVKLTDFFAAHEADWTAAAQSTKDFLKQQFPAGSVIRQDDIAKALHSILEVDSRLKAKLATERLTQKYWVGDFADLVIDRVWTKLT